MGERAIMQEISRVTEETPINSEETKQLIERFSDPSFATTGSGATVKDLAETLDMNPALVAAGLEKLRAEKVAHRQQSLAVMNVSPPLHFQKQLAGILIFVALGIMSVLFLVLTTSSKEPPPVAPPASRPEPARLTPLPEKP